MSKAAKKAPRKKVANGYQMPEPIPKGVIVTDLKKQRWIIGSSIGVGGFGEIYSAALYKDKTPSDYPTVVKIEPHGNGPLFVEMHFYMRNASMNDIEKWKKDQKLPELGMPRFLGSGSHEYNGTKYRFVVMDRYGTDLWKLFLENGRYFPEHTVYKISWQIINVLEYIHNKTYVHADIKGGNLLLDLKSQNQVYLLDFGLASHYTTKDEYKTDPKKAHNGTIEYTSRDAHKGVPTMRGDFEILAFNMIQWLCGKLPWENNLKDPVKVQAAKEKAFDNVQKFLKECFTPEDVPETITQFMNLLALMKFNDIPNYNHFREILEKGLKKLGHKPTGKLVFSSGEQTKTKTPTKKTKASKNEAAKDSPKAKPTPVKISRTKAKEDSFDNSLDTSIDSIILDAKCMKGTDLRKKLLANLDGDAEYEVQVKKRKIRQSPFRSPKTNTTVKESPSNVVKRTRRKIEPVANSSVSEDEVVVISGTKSRPTARKNLIQNTRKTRSSDKIEYDSEKDMFED